MKKSRLILLSFVPLAIGYFVNLTITVPVIGVMAYYILPLFTTAFWFYLGTQYARSNWNTIPAILIGNAPGAASLLLYLWQFLLETDKTRSMVLAVISQLFSASTPLYLFGRIALLFEPQPNTIGRASMVAMQVISVVYMFIVFSVAFGREKKRLNKTIVD